MSPGGACQPARIRPITTIQRLGIVIAASIATTALVGTVAVWTASSVEGIALDLSVRRVPGLIALSGVADAIDAADRNISRLVNPALGDREERARLRARVSDALEALARAEAEYGAVPRSEELDRLWHAYLVARESWLARARAAADEIARRDALVEHVADPAAYELRAARTRAAIAYRAMMNAHEPASAAVEAIRARTRHEVQALGATVAPAVRRARVFFWGTFLAGSALLLAGLLLTTRAIRGAIGGLVSETGKLTDAVQAGRLDVRGDPAVVSSEFRSVVEGVNQTVEAFVQVRGQLVEAQKMETIGRLAGGVAHDFNNILTSVVGSAHLAREALPERHAAREDLEQILADAARATALVRQLLAFARRTVVKPRRANLGELVRALEGMLRRLIGENVELVFRAPSLPGAVMVDPTHLEQLVVNLVVNARDALPDGGRVTVEVGEVELTPAEAGALGVAPGPHAVLRVTDTGPGIPAELADRIFEPFFTTKGAGRGTGLGLATCRAIARESGGAISLAASPGPGATFVVHLPVVGDEPDEATAPLAPARRGGTEVLLLVEDEAPVRAMAGRVLRELGYTVLEAGTVDEAIARADGHAGAIGLLVTDLVLPGGSGRQVAEHVARTRPATRILFVSGYTDDVLARQGIRADEVAFLAKPYTPEGIGRAVRAALDAPAARGVGT